MATTTTNYALKKYEGTDMFNPLTFENTNADSIDQAMFENKQASIGSATELVTGTVHAITRQNADSPYMVWTATGNYAVGDTFTVDGTPVTAINTANESLEDGCIITGSQVFAALRATILTVYAIKQADLSGVEQDITDINTKIGTTSIAGIGDGSITGAIKHLDYHVFSAPVVSVPVDTAWGSLYSSTVINIDISSLGLLVAPSQVFVEFLTSSGIAMAVLATRNATTVGVQLVRGTSSTVSGTVVALVIA